MLNNPFYLTQAWVLFRKKNRISDKRLTLYKQKLDVCIGILRITFSSIKYANHWFAEYSSEQIKKYYSDYENLYK